MPVLFHFLQSVDFAVFNFYAFNVVRVIQSIEFEFMEKDSLIRSGTLLNFIKRLHTSALVRRLKMSKFMISTCILILTDGLIYVNNFFEMHC